MKLKTKLLIVYSSIIGLIVLGIIAINIFGNKRSLSLSEFNESMLVAENFNKKFRTTDNKVIFFLSVDCEPCNAAFKRIIQESNKIQNTLTIILVFSEENKSVSSFLNSSSILLKENIFVYNDKNRKLSFALDVKSYPTLFKIENDKILIKGDANKYLPTIFL